MKNQELTKKLEELNFPPEEEFKIRQTNELIKAINRINLK